MASFNSTELQQIATFIGIKDVKNIDKQTIIDKISTNCTHGDCCLTSGGKWYSVSNILFYLSSIAALLAGISEIMAIQKRSERNENQNIWTPLLIMLVKLFMLPKMVCNAKTMKRTMTFLGPKDAAYMSKVVAFLIWAASFVLVTISVEKQHRSIL